MKNLDLKRIHFIGIGGISMSSLAEILSNEGFIISGSDSTNSDITKHLQAIGINFSYPQSAENITDDIELVVYTAAIKEDNPELVAAREKNIKTIDRAELVGLMMKSYTYPISVAGTHGKTTTTSMLTEIFMAADKNPTVTIGGILNSINGTFKIGTNDYFIVETCEYCDSFLKFNPYSAIILNIDKDHTDYFKTMEQMYNSFNSFAKRLPKDGLLVINNDIKDIEKVTKDIDCRVLTYGEDSSADWYAENISFDENGNGSYTAFCKGKAMGAVKLNVPGVHNIYNSLAAFALSTEHGLPAEKILKGLSAFCGTKRRFELKGVFNNVTVIDDYAHHPTEIKSTLSAAKAHNINKLWCVFQPHTFSRTKSLLDEFSEAFDCADSLILVDIYAAREKDLGEVHSKDLAEKIKARNKAINVIYAESFEKAVELLKKSCQPNDMLITMGAGNVYKIGEMILK